MNTNGNAYTVIYTTIVVTLVAAILAFVAMTLKPKQDANIKAETISQMLTAAQFFTKDECSAMGNDKVLEAYSQNIKEAYTINLKGEKVRDLNTEVKSIELQDGLKAQNKNIKDGSDAADLPVYVFNKDGKSVTVVPVYGAGLWGPIWGYIALDEDLQTIVGAYFDHDSETPGLGAKIKDDPSFRAEFIGKKVNVASDPVFSVVKVGTSADENSSVDAITGATMTSKGLGEAIAFWLKAYAPFLSSAAPAKECCGGNGGECDGSKPCCSESSEAGCCSDSSAVKCPVTE
jgi:Na+-transporting NADH:ubiquinone oxidoreductase subunit C|uniref:NADH:ubiquinone reductase (Na(+)-transporting) subunit C n=1 Tax=Candidatus Cryptobacteroides bacterium TaxID=3085639 RepID=UPI00402618F6